MPAIREDANEKKQKQSFVQNQLTILVSSTPECV